MVAALDELQRARTADDVRTTFDLLGVEAAHAGTVGRLAIRARLTQSRRAHYSTFLGFGAVHQDRAIALLDDEDWRVGAMPRSRSWSW